MSIIHKQTKNAEFFAACSRILKVSRPVTVANYPLISAILVKLDALHEEYSESFEKVKVKSDFKEQNVKLDNAIRSFFYLYQSYQLASNVVYTNAVQKLGAVLKNYGLDMVRENSEEEPALCKAMLRDLNNQAMAEAIAALPNMQMAIAGIQSALSAFEKSRMAYNKARAIDKNKRTATVIKKEYQKLLNKEFLPNIRAARNHFSAEFTSYANTIDQIVLDNNRIVTRKSPVEISEKEIV